MKSEMLGKNTSQVEVTNISSHGIWILSNDEEMFLSYDDFPWFKDVTIGKILNIEEPFPNHFYWPDLDVDLSTEIIKNPQRFPLKHQL
ncbi:MAG TPA: integron cassette protein [Cyanothece sp. UBA12306]|nr:integron cassette protein [Cyanothece sp. UBA12306]